MVSRLCQLWNWVSRLTLLILFCLGFYCSNPPLAAAEVTAAPSPQESTEQVAPIRLEVDPSNISSEKVSQFVHACLQVVALIERREGELQGAETDSESVRIEQEIEAEALKLIEAAGLTRQEYLQLLGLANTDPEFGERIAIQLQEAAG